MPDLERPRGQRQAVVDRHHLRPPVGDGDQHGDQFDGDRRPEFFGRSPVDRPVIAPSPASPPPARFKLESAAPRMAARARGVAAGGLLGSLLGEAARDGGASSSLASSLVISSTLVEFCQALSSFVKDSLGRFVCFQGLAERRRGKWPFVKFFGLGRGFARRERRLGRSRTRIARFQKFGEHLSGKPRKGLGFAAARRSTGALRMPSQMAGTARRDSFRFLSPHGTSRGEEWFPSRDPWPGGVLLLSAGRLSVALPWLSMEAAACASFGERVEPGVAWHLQCSAHSDQAHAGGARKIAVGKER